MTSVFRGIGFSLLVLITCLLSFDKSGAELFSPWAIEKLVGKNAPELTARDLSGNAVLLSSFKGRPVLLNFWATWCPYCREERQYLNSLYSDYRDQGLVIIAVSTDRSPQRLKDYLKKIPSEFIVLHDSSNKAAETYGVYSVPTNFLIDHNGVIRHKLMGLRNWTDSASRKLIEKLFQSE